eukprot:TRINITY_DN5709_c0_g1_i2.p1 TRINITY_DN5709_c0_g1~~TRINITY_DN5709_c0_g1_i2.p1  ORF type:complete len:356 (-),score=83.43 TRINITY_DN5709_c0_g1_i2:86-1153(-)
MLVGYPPFFSDDPSTTCQKILHWRKTLVIPSEANLTLEATDLINRLLTDANERLGVNGVEEIKAHPFFIGIDWKRIREKTAPFIPQLGDPFDTSYFDDFAEEEPWYMEEDPKITKKVRKDPDFIGYTFKRDFEQQQRSSLVDALEHLETMRASQPRPQTHLSQGNVVVLLKDQQTTKSSGQIPIPRPHTQSHITEVPERPIPHAEVMLKEPLSSGKPVRVTPSATGPANKQPSPPIAREPGTKTINLVMFGQPTLTTETAPKAKAGISNVLNGENFRTPKNPTINTKGFETGAKNLQQGTSSSSAIRRDKGADIRNSPTPALGGAFGGGNPSRPIPSSNSGNVLPNKPKFLLSNK